MAVLRTDYQEDIFTGNRKYTTIDNGDNTVSFVDVTQYSTMGDRFGAADINATNAEVNAVNSNLAGIDSELTANSNKFYFDYKNGEYGFNTSSERGADTFHPFKKAIPTPYVFTGTSGRYTVPATGKYFLYASTAATGAYDHDCSVTATISRGGSVLVRAYASYYMYSRNDGLFASQSAQVQLTQGQVLTFSASGAGWDGHHLGQQFVVVYSGG